ncbi:MAG: response regulator transcription factor [Alphaproteobacteria bacterium]|nr:response regulator transcription factor [Alphaproteobacteria bacterium]
MADQIVYVVDDSQDVRDSLAILLEVSGYRVRTYASALDFLKVVEPDWAGCIVADVRMPGMTGIEMQKELLARSIHLPVVIITAHADVPMAVAALKAGAVDFIEKPFRDEILLGSIRSSLALPRPSPSKAASARAFEIGTLSPREQEVMTLLVAGHPNKVVADRLGISTRTVEVHRAHIMEKTNARNIAELVRMACMNDLADGRE